MASYKELKKLAEEIKEKAGVKIKTVAVAEAALIKAITENYKKVKKSDYSPEALQILAELFPSKSETKKENPANDSKNKSKKSKISWKEIAEEINKSGMYDPLFDTEKSEEELEKDIRKALKEAPLEDDDFGEDEDLLDPKFKKILAKQGLFQSFKEIRKEETKEAIENDIPLKEEKRMTRFRATFLFFREYVKEGNNASKGKIKEIADLADKYCQKYHLPPNFKETLHQLRKVFSVAEYIKYED